MEQVNNMDMVNRFPYAIWFQSNKEFQAEISFVNTQYRYQVFCKTTGKLFPRVMMIRCQEQKEKFYLF